VLAQLLELHVACRALLGRLASREDGKELAEAMTLELKLETHARARLPQRLDGHRADRAHRAIGAAKGRLGWGLMLGDLVGDVPCPARNLASLKPSRPDARRPVRLDLDAHERVLPLAVTVELVEVGEHFLGGTIDLDAVLDHCPS